MNLECLKMFTENLPPLAIRFSKFDGKSFVNFRTMQFVFIHGKQIFVEKMARSKDGKLRWGYYHDEKSSHGKDYFDGLGEDDGSILTHNEVEQYHEEWLNSLGKR